MPITFQAIPTSRGPNGAWTHLEIPFSVEQEFGSRAMVQVVGTINGFPIRTSLMPRGDGIHYLAVTKAMLAGARIAPGDLAQITLDRDHAPRTVDLPEDLLAALDPAAQLYLHSLSYSHQKEFADWIISAKRPKTRTRRIVRSQELLAARQHLAR